MCLKEGKIPFTDYYNKNIILMDREGQMLTDSRQKGVTLQELWGIAYHPTQDCLLVCEITSGHVTFLHPTTLCEMTKVEMSGISHPTGVCVMSDGNIVVSGKSAGAGGSWYNPDSVGVFDIHGTQLHLWHTYNRAGQYGCIYHITCDDKDNILVSDQAHKQIIKLDKTCRFLCERSTSGHPCGLTVAGDIVLVAEINPDCVRAYNLQDRQVLTSDRGQCQFDMISSLSIQDNDLTVVGKKGLRMYKLNNK